MYTHVAKYENFNGQQVQEEINFNFTTPELLRFQKKYGGSDALEKTLENIVKTQDACSLIDFIEDIVGAAYGVVSEDGGKFLKSPERTKEFFETAAWSALLEDMLSDMTLISTLLVGAAPARIRDNMADLEKKGVDITSPEAVRAALAETK